MKRIIFVIVFAFVSLATTAQTYTVLDTTIQQNTKYQVIQNGLERIERNLIKVFDNEKVETDTMTYFNATRSLLSYFDAGLNQYGKLFQSIDTLVYEKISTEPYIIATGQTVIFDYFLNGNDSTQIGLIHEWDSLNVRINELQNDHDIKYVDAVSEFQKIKERQAILEKRYNQIKSQ